MKLPLFRPSAALAVSRDTPLLECVRLMNNRGIGAILIVDSKESNHLLGIFTERDLLKHYEAIKSGSTDIEPIGRHMTTEVISLPIARLHESAELMIRHGIRHVVLIENEEGGANPLKKLAGVISIRDVLGQFVKSVGRGLEEGAILHRQVLLISNADDSRKMMRALLSRFPDVDLKTMESLDDATAEIARATDCLFFDLDRLPKEGWASFLKRVLAQELSGRKIAVMYNPMAMRQTELTVLEMLATGKRIHILEKPLSVGDLTELLMQ